MSTVNGSWHNDSNMPYVILLGNALDPVPGRQPGAGLGSGIDHAGTAEAVEGADGGLIEAVA